MQFLTAQLDDPAVEPCGVCDNCTGQPVPDDIDPALVTAADAYLRRRPLHIEPKKQGIKAGERHEVGRVLCRWGDAGWAPLVEKGMADGYFDDELIGAVFQLLAEWRPDPDPEWVAAVPSARGGPDGDLVVDFAARLAGEIGLPYLDLVERIRDRPPQRSLQNSHHQKENVHGAFAVIDESARHARAPDRRRLRLGMDAHRGRHDPPAGRRRPGPSGVPRIHDRPEHVIATGLRFS